MSPFDVGERASFARSRLDCVCKSSQSVCVQVWPVCVSLCILVYLVHIYIYIYAV